MVRLRRFTLIRASPFGDLQRKRRNRRTRYVNTEEWIDDSSTTMQRASAALRADGRRIPRRVARGRSAAAPQRATLRIGPGFARLRRAGAADTARRSPNRDSMLRRSNPGSGPNRRVGRASELFQRKSRRARANAPSGCRRTAARCHRRTATNRALSAVTILCSSFFSCPLVKQRSATRTISCCCA
jgi:hypothetical protein